MAKALAKPTSIKPQRLSKPVAEPTVQEEVTETAPEETMAKSAPRKHDLINDRGPSQITVSRAVRLKFRKSCVANDRTMSDVIEELMENYATENGY